MKLFDNCNWYIVRCFRRWHWLLFPPTPDIRAMYRKMRKERGWWHVIFPDYQ